MTALPRITTLPLLLLSLASPCLTSAAEAGQAPSTNKDFLSWAQTPPMGWNSWDCFGTSVTEQQTKEQAAFMAEHLRHHGWSYIVVDIQWYEANAKGHDYVKNAPLAMDGYGRLQPATNKFPSAEGGKGFRSLADHVHSLGLKFGIHLMRGIPRQAVEKNLPISGTKYFAADIADKVHVCPWNPDMYGVDMSKPGAQEYYDSVFAQMAEWGVDYVKVDDLSRPYFQNQREVEAIRKAIDKTGRPMVLSLSPGATDLKAADHVRAHANAWRISDDFWDRWSALREQFGRLAAWNPHRTAGAWPDADMLPLGTLVMGKRTTRFTDDEQYTLMSLWSIARSPLMHGGDMTDTDDFTLSLLTNDEVLAVNQASIKNRPLFDRDGLIAWTAEDPATGDTYLALFNTRDRVSLTEANARQPAVVISRTPEVATEIDTPLDGAKSLHLVAEVLDEADAFTGVRWKTPRWIMEDGTERSVTETEWTAVDAQWDSATVAKINGQRLPDITAQATAHITYAIPEGARRFKASVSVRTDDKDTRPGKVRVLAVLATERNENRGPGLIVEVPLADLGIKGPVMVRDLWARQHLGSVRESLSLVVPFHGAKLLRLHKEK